MHTATPSSFARVLLPLFALSLSAAAVGCAAEELDESDAVIGSEDELRALTRSEILGTLGRGETKEIAAAPKPFYRAFALEVAAGERLDVTVRSDKGDGDPQAWLLGPTFATLARSVDVSATDPSARLTRTITKPGTYYVAVRDEASREVTFTVSRNGEAPPPAPVATCTSDAQCGGAAAMCFIDRCVTVSETSFAVDGTHMQGTARAAYGSAGDLRVAYQSWRSGGTHTLWSGPLGALKSSGATTSETPFGLLHAPGQDPVLATSYYHYEGGGVSYGAFGGPRLGYRERVGQFTFARNVSGTVFAVFTGITPAPVNSYQSDKCTLHFASRPAHGAWGAMEKVDDCGWGGYRNLAVHVRKDGGADIVAAREFGSVLVYRRQNPIDPWAKTTLVAQKTTNTRPYFVATHGADGTTHVVAQSYDFTTDSSRGDYEGIYLELGDAGPIRTIPLSTHRTQWTAPFPDVDVDGAGNVWIQKRPAESYDRSAVLRIDPAGRVAERSLGLMATGSWRYSALAVAPKGEIAVVHHGDNRNVFVRKFTPVAP